MANYATLKAAIQQVVKTNGSGEITGALLQQTLFAMVGSLGADYLFVGIAQQSTNPGTPDQNVFYMAAAGTYPNFNNSVVPSGYLGVLKYNGSWTVETVLVGKDYDTQIADILSILEQVITYSIAPSPNLFNKATITQGQAVSIGYGSLFPMSNTSASDFIPIPDGATSIYLTSLRGYGSAGWAVYDANKNYIRGTNNTRTIAIQSGEKYLRFSVLDENVDTAMVIVGTESDVPAQYMPYGNIVTAALKDNTVTTSKIANGAVTGQKLADNSISGQKLADGAITKDKADFIIKTYHASKNLLNPSECVNGFIRFANGTVGGNSSTPRYATGFIPVDAVGIYSNCFNAYGSTAGWAVYDANKNYIRGAAQNPNSSYTYQSGDAFIRLTIITSGLGSSHYVVKATDPHEYTDYFTPYYTYQLASEIKLTPETKLPAYEPAASLTGFLGVGQNALTLANSTVTLEDCPQYLKRQFNLSFAAKISTFENVDIGVGKDTFNGTFLRVDATNIYLCRYYNGNVSIVYTQAHGLTIGDFINISALMDDGILTARIGTISGVFTHSFNRLGGVDSYGKPFVTASANSALTNYEFRYAGTEFRKPIWVIGDSYTSWYSQRWPVQMIDTLGVKSFMLDGLAGGTSATLFEELQKLLVYGTPKFLLWCLGMNDSYTNWQKTFDQLLALCEEKGITLVPQTIPWPDGGNKSEINAAIAASGLRYLDGYASVSSDNNGTWYHDYSEDGVHTSVIGAKAMASRFLSDFPEFLQ